MGRDKESESADTALQASTQGEFDPGKAPANRRELAAWVRRVLGVRVCNKAMIAGHDCPLDYLSHAFFEHSDGPRDCVVWANRGGGKTMMGAIATLCDMVFKPGIEIRILGGSLEQSKHMHNHLRALIAQPGIAPMLHGRITERRISLTNGSVVELLAQSQTSVRGTRVHKLRCDELELFDPEVWEAAQLVTRSGNCGSVRVRGSIECLSTMHEPSGLMRTLIKQARQGTRTLFQWNVLDVLERCPKQRDCQTCLLLPECAKQAKSKNAGHLCVQDAVDMKQRVAGATWEAEMLCARPRRTNSVLPEFDTKIHVVDEHLEPVKSWLWLAGMDFGFRSPTVVLFAALDNTGVLRVFDERIKSGIVLDQHIDAIIQGPWPKPAWIGVDPAGAQCNSQTGTSDITQLRGAGLAIRFRAMGIQRGLALVRARLDPASNSSPRLLIHKRCKGLIDSLERYHYPKDQPFSDVPVKDGPDHAVDALRYLITNLDQPHVTTHSCYT